MLSAETGSSLLFSGIAPSPISSTNSGLLIAADVSSGLAAPLHAPFSSIEDRASGWKLPPNAGFSGLAFGPAAQQLFGAASSGPQSASNLLTMDPYTGVQKVAPVPIRAAAQALHISDLATVPGRTYQLYGLGRPVATPSASFQLYVIDPGSGQAVAIADQPAWLASLSSADALAFGPDGTLYVGGQEKVGNAAVLYVQQPDGDDPRVTRHTLTDSILGMDARVIGSESQGAQVEVLTVVAGGHLRWLDPASGQFTSTVALSGPVRGVAGDIAFHPAPDSLTLQQVHHADFETGANGYTADNAIQVMPGMWHHSPGRWDDKLINHTYGQQKMPGFNWYYGQFETSLGGGTYLTNYHHAGVLASPLISVPECATTTLSFSYLLDVRPPLDADFVEVWAQFTDEAGQVQRTRLMSRAEGTLPQTGNRWLTATADLSPFGGRAVQIQFVFDTGNVPDVDPEGWYVDDVVVASMPKALCGYKFHDLDSDGRWDPGEPGLNDWRIYVDRNGNGRYDPAVPARTFAGGLDANTFASGRRVVHPDGHAVLEVSATGEPIWATPDPFQPSRKVLAWGTGTGEEVWPVGPMLRATFPTAVHTVALDVARADAAAGSTRVVLQAFDQHGNRIAEQVRMLADAQWQTLTVSVTGGEIAYVKASVDQGSARFNDLRFWGTSAAVEGDPSFVTRHNGQHNGAFWFDRLPPGVYTLREELPEGWWRQSYPGSPDFAHTVIVTAGNAAQGRWEHTEAPNFGNNYIGIIAGFKWEDSNGDGAWDPDEPGLNGRIIYIDENNNGQRDPGEPWTETHNNGIHDGAYSFEVWPGTYTIREDLPSEWNQSYPLSPDDAPAGHTVTVGPRETVQGVYGAAVLPNFGNWTSAIISLSAKFEDRDADGQPREDGEPGLSGWTVFVDYNGNGILDTDEPSGVTGADGQYTIERIRPGTWQVREVLQDEWTNSYPPGGSYEQTFLSGQTVTGLDFGNWTWAGISGMKFEDLDADGQPREDGEPGLPGWTIFVDYNDNGILDDDEPSGVTGADGQYTIERIRPGMWQVREVLQDEWTNSDPPGGSYEQTFLFGQTVTGLDFGNWTWAGISGMKFEDLDADGQPREDGEPGLPGWTIFVDYNDNGILDDDEPSGVTGADGQYAIERIRPGTWQVREVPQDGWTNSYPPGGSYEQEFLSRQTVTGLDFGNWTWASVSGEKYEVENGGTLGSGLLGWTIYVDYNDNAMLDPGEPFAVSGVDGSYTIPEIKTGTYKVREVPQAGWKISQPIQGFHELTLRSRQHIPDVDFGNERIPVEPQVVQFITPMSVYRLNGPFVRPPDSQIAIGGYVWDDRNRNGDWDPGEPGLDGWTVYVDLNEDGRWNAGEPAFATTFDGAHHGAYWFKWDALGLDLLTNRSGEFTVRLRLPLDNGSEPDAQDPGHVIRTSFDDLPDPTSDQPPPPRASLGEFGVAQSPNFGSSANGSSEHLGSIEGYLWHDINQNGVWETGEPGRAGWVVYLDLNKNGVYDAFDPTKPEAQPEPFAITGADGRYVFAGVEPDTYTVRVDRAEFGGTSDGTFAVQRFLGAPLGEWVVEVEPGETVRGGWEATEKPNFGTFDYSPLVRPADEQYGYYALASSDQKQTLLTAWEPWQSFQVTNLTGADYRISAVDKVIDTSKIAVADQFVTVFRKQADGTLTPIAPLELQRQSSRVSLDDPIPVPVGQSVQFYAFYDPAIRNAGRVLEQFPDWLGAKRGSHPAHTFGPNDHLNVLTDASTAYRIDLVGGSTYDSDIFYDGAVTRGDIDHLDDLLLSTTITEDLQIPYGHRLFDPTADINARCPNGAGGTIETCVWPLGGVPSREIGLGDLGPLNAEWNRARAPFLDLDADNSSGAKGVAYVAVFRGSAVEIADVDARFANSVERILDRLTVTITNPSPGAGDRLEVDEAKLPEGIGIEENGPRMDVDGNETVVLVLAGQASIEDYTFALHCIRYSNNDATGVARTVNIGIQARGIASTTVGLPFTRLLHDWELDGNTATARIRIPPSDASEVLEIPNTGQTLSGEAEALFAAATWSSDEMSEIGSIERHDALVATDGGKGANTVGSQDSTSSKVSSDDGVVSGDDAVTVGEHSDGYSVDVDLPPNRIEARSLSEVTNEARSTIHYAPPVIDSLNNMPLDADEEPSPGPPLELRGDGTQVSIPSALIAFATTPRVEEDDRVRFGFDADSIGDSETHLPSVPLSEIPPVQQAVRDESDVQAGGRSPDVADEVTDLDAMWLDVEALLGELVGGLDGVRS